MNFCPIMPVKAFEHFGSVSKYHMALAQFLQIKPYFDFFQKKLAEGDTVILDNGAYEGAQMSDMDLCRWAHCLKPSVLVLPDEPNDFMKTIYKSEKYLDHYGLPYKTEGMMVLHAEPGKTRQFEAFYEACPTSWIGFSRLTRNYGVLPSLHWSEQRTNFATYLKDCGLWRQDLHHHALGMLNGNVDELKWLKAEGFESCDSSAPIWRGLHGYDLIGDWPNYEFSPLIDDKVCSWTLAEKNLKLVMEVVK